MEVLRLSYRCGDVYFKKVRKINKLRAHLFNVIISVDGLEECCSRLFRVSTTQRPDDVHRAME